MTAIVFVHESDRRSLRRWNELQSISWVRLDAGVFRGLTTVIFVHESACSECQYVCGLLRMWY